MSALHPPLRRRFGCTRLLNPRRIRRIWLGFAAAGSPETSLEREAPIFLHSQYGYQHMFRFFAALFCGIAFLVGTTVFVYASPDNVPLEELNKKVEAKKQLIRELESQMEVYKKAIEEVRTQATSLKSVLSLLENRIAGAALDIHTSEVAIEAATLELEALQLGISEKEADIARKRAALGTFIRAMHTYDQKSFVGALLTEPSFSTFVTHEQYLTDVSREVGVLLRTVTRAKGELEERRTQTNEKKALLEQLKRELEHKRQDLVEEKGAKTRLLGESRSNEKRFQSLVSKLKAQAEQIEGEIRSLEVEARRRLEKKGGVVEAVGRFSWPTAGRYLTTIFHDPEYPFRHIFEHPGIDIRASQGSPITASASGYVARARNAGMGYSYIMLLHGDGLATVYGHVSKIIASQDTYVSRGDVIGYVGGMPGTPGAGPFTTGPHLHFEIRQNGIPANPMQYLE